MFKLISRTALAGIGLSIFLASAPVHAASPASGAAQHQTADQPSEFSSRRKAQRYVKYPRRYRQVRSYKARSYHARGYARVRHVHRGYVQRGRYAYKTRHVHRQAHGATRGGSVSLAGVTGPLAAKAQQIVAACGSRVVSAVRSGNGHSHHSTGNAVDLQGNPSCIYSMLRGWPGGVTTDYASAPGGAHVHVSYAPGGREWGLRFAHGGGSRYYRAARAAYAQAYAPRAYRVKKIRGKGPRVH